MNANSSIHEFAKTVQFTKPQKVNVQISWNKSWFITLISLKFSANVEVHFKQWKKLISIFDYFNAHRQQNLAKWGCKCCNMQHQYLKLVFCNLMNENASAIQFKFSCRASTEKWLEKEIFFKCFNV